MTNNNTITVMTMIIFITTIERLGRDCRLPGGGPRAVTVGRGEAHRGSCQNNNYY